MSSTGSMSGADYSRQYEQMLRRMQDLQEEHENETKQLKASNEAALDHQTKAYQERLKEREQQTDQTLANYRDRLEDSHRSSQESSNEAIRKIRKDTYDRFGKIRESDGAVQKKQAEGAIEGAQKAFDHSLKSEKEHSAFRFEALEKDLQKKSEKDALLLRNEHQTEMDQTKQEMKRIAGLEDSYIKAKGKGTVDAYRELESGHKMMLDQVTDSTQRQLKDKTDDMRLADETNKQRLIDVIQESDARTQKAITSQRAESEKNINYLKKEYEHDLGVRDSNMQNLKQRTEEKVEGLMKKGQERLQNSLTDQANGFHQEIKQKEQAYHGELDDLRKKSVAFEKDFTPQDVPTQVKNKMERQWTEKYEKALDAERSSSKTQLDTTRGKYTEMARSAQEEAEKKVVDAHRKGLEDNYHLRNDFMHLLKENETSAKMQSQTSSENNRVHTERQYRDHSYELKNQHERYMEAMEDLLHESKEQLREVRSESETKARLKEQEVSIKHQDDIRELKRQLDEVVDNHRFQTLEMKENFEKSIRDFDRQKQNELEAMQRGNDLKLKEQELQQKRREQTLVENYENELVKLRKTNALLSKKKS